MHRVWTHTPTIFPSFFCSLIMFFYVVLMKVGRILRLHPVGHLLSKIVWSNLLKLCTLDGFISVLRVTHKLKLLHCMQLQEAF